MLNLKAHPIKFLRAVKKAFKQVRRWRGTHIPKLVVEPEMVVDLTKYRQPVWIDELIIRKGGRVIRDPDSVTIERIVMEDVE